MCLMMDVCSRGSSTGWLTRASIALILRVACPSPRLADGAALGRAPPSSGSMLDASSRAGAFSASVTGMSKTAVARISNVTEMCSARVSVTRLLSRSRSWAWRSATEPHEGFDWLAPSNASMVGRRSVPSRRSGRGRGVHPGFGMDGWTRFRSRLVLAGSFRSRRRVRGGGGAWVLAAPRIARPAIAAKSRKPSCRFPDADRWERVEFECRLRGLVPVWGRIVHTYCVTR